MTSDVQFAKIPNVRLWIAVFVALCFTGLEFLLRDRDLVFYLLAPPYYIDRFTVKTGLWFSYVALIYNVLWALTFAFTWRKKYIFWGVVALFLISHGILTYLAIPEFSKGFGEALRH